MKLKLSTFALFATANNLVRGDEPLGGLEGTFARVASCIGEKDVSLDTSCIVAKFLSLAVEDEEFDLDICAPPSIEKSVQLLDKAGKECDDFGNGENPFGGINPFDAVLLFDGCWKDFCEDFTGNVKDTIDEGITKAKESILEIALKCDNVDISLDNCVASTSLDLVFEAFAGTLGGEMEEGNRFLESNIDMMNEICQLPEIAFGAVTEFTDQALEKCVANGYEDSQDDVLQVENTIKSLYSCVATFCEDTIDTVDELIDEGKAAVQGFITETLNQCGGDSEKFIPQDSCVISTSIEWILQSILEPMGNVNETDNSNRRSLSYYDTAIANNVCGAVLSMVDPAMFMELVAGAAYYCDVEGELTDVQDAISKYFGTCLPSQCIEAVQDGISAVKNLAVEEISSCTGVPLSLDSCVVSSSMDFFLMGALSGSGEQPSAEMEPAQRRMMDNFEQDGVLNSAEICGLAPMNGESILAIVNGGKSMCLAQDEDVSGYDDMLMAINSLFSDGSCLATFCEEVQTPVEDIVETVEDIMEAVNLEQTALDFLFECSDIKVDPDSCVERAFVEETLQYYLNADDEVEYQPKVDARRARGRKVRKARRHLALPSTKAPNFQSTKAPSGSTKTPSGSTKAPTSSSSKAPSGYSTKNPKYYSTKSPNYYSTKSPKNYSTKSPGNNICPLKIPSETALLDVYQKSVDRCNAEGAITIPNGELVRVDSFVEKLVHGDKCYESLCSEDAFLYILSKSVGKLGDVCDNLNASSESGQMFMQLLCPVKVKNENNNNSEPPSMSPSLSSRIETTAPTLKDEEDETSSSSHPTQRFGSILAMLAAMLYFGA